MTTTTVTERTLLRPGIGELSHSLPVVEQENEKDHGRRQKGRRDDLHEERDQHKGRPGMRTTVPAEATSRR